MTEITGTTGTARTPETPAPAETTAVQQPAPPTPHDISIETRLWAGILLGLTAAGVHTIVGYTSAHYSCDMNYKRNLYFVTASSLLLCLVGFFSAWSTRSASASDEEPGQGRRHFMMVAGLALSAGCALFTLAGLLAIFIIHPCD